jgi:hypothetical protein
MIYVCFKIPIVLRERDLEKEAADINLGLVNLVI